MPTEGEPVLVGVYCQTEKQQQEAVAALRAVRPEQVAVYEGVVEGWADEEAIGSLVEQGLIVDVVDMPAEQPPEPADAPAVPGLAPKKESAAPYMSLSRLKVQTAADHLQDFKAKGEQVRLGKSGLEIADESEPGLASLAPEGGAGPGAAAAAAAGGDFFNLRARAPLTPEQRTALERLDVEIILFSPPAAYKVFLTPEQRQAVEQLPFVVRVDRYSVEQTVTPELMKAVEAIRQQTGSGDEASLQAAGAEAPPVPEEYDVVCHRPDDRASLETVLAGTEGVTVLDSSSVVIRFRASLEASRLEALLAGLADLPQVRKLLPHRKARLFSDRGRKLIGVEAVNAGAAERWTGAGEVVGVVDSGVDDAHPDLADRVKFRHALAGADTKDILGHGTHVAGIIAGTGAASEKAVRGVAPGAELSVVRVTDDDGALELPPDLGDVLVKAVEDGAKIINLSLGYKLAGVYAGYSDSVDRFVCAHPDVLVVVAAGNDGFAPQGHHWLNTVGAPATAKNVLTVGACASDRPDFPNLWGALRPGLFGAAPAAEEPAAGNPDLPAAISGRGPTDNESIKPDVLAPGTYVLSAKSSTMNPHLAWADYEPQPDRYVFVSGTSMAAPMVAGAAALVRQYLREERNCPEPSAALLKAILVASARKLPSLRDPAAPDYFGYPDFDQGFGRVDVSAVLPSPDAPNRKVEWDDVPNDHPEKALESRPVAGGPRKAMRTYRITVAEDAAEPLCVVLSWTDPAANWVQNNLELVVEAPSGARTRGNAEHAYQKTRWGQLTPEELRTRRPSGAVAPDKRNNVEQVVLQPAQSGVYRIRVFAESTAFPPQGYALCVRGALGSSLEAES